MTEQVSDKALSSLELRLEADIMSDSEQSALVCFEEFYQAKAGLFKAISAVAERQDESATAAAEYEEMVNTALVEAARCFARTVLSIDDYGDRLNVAAGLSRESFSELQSFIGQYESDITLSIGSDVNYRERFINYIDTQDPGSAENLEVAFGQAFSLALNPLFEYVSKNEDDINQ